MEGKDCLNRFVCTGPVSSEKYFLLQGGHLSHGKSFWVFFFKQLFNDRLEQ